MSVSFSSTNFMHSISFNVFSHFLTVFTWILTKHFEDTDFHFFRSSVLHSALFLIPCHLFRLFGLSLNILIFGYPFLFKRQFSPERFLQFSGRELKTFHLISLFSVSFLSITTLPRHPQIYSSFSSIPPESQLPFSCQNARF